MAIKSFTLTAMEGRRFPASGKSRPSQVRIDHSNTITNIVIEGPGRAQIDFRYNVNYQGLGEVKLEGSLIFEGELSDLETTWQKHQRMPNKVAEQVHNTILSNGSFEVMQLAHKLKLPPPIKIEVPRIHVKDDSKGSTPAGVNPDLFKP